MKTEKFTKQRDKIVEAGSKLFLSKGYNETTVNDILAEAGISKGTFYHYFESKDEIFDAVVSKFLDDTTASIEALIAANGTLSAIEKIKLIFTRPKNNTEQELSEQFTQKADLTMHIRSYIGVAERLGPIIAKIIEQGIAEGAFQTDYPLDFAEYVIISQIMIDEEFFRRSPEELQHKMRFMADYMERYLAAPKGSFDFLFNG